MRYLLMVACGLSLALAAVGCKTVQYTAGVCDCDPPPVHSVLKSPYTGAAQPAPVVVMPRADHGH